MIVEEEEKKKKKRGNDDIEDDRYIVSGITIERERRARIEMGLRWDGIVCIYNWIVERRQGLELDCDFKSFPNSVRVW
jgi:hypothetical protein